MTEAEQWRIRKLHPDVVAKFLLVLDHCAKEGIDLFIGRTYEDPSKQAQHYADGKTTLKMGWHQIARAADCYPKLPDGQPDLNGKQLGKFRRMHEIASVEGFHGLAFNPDGTKRLIQVKKNGKLIKIWDGGHLEYRHPYDTLEQALKAELHNYEGYV